MLEPVRFLFGFLLVGHLTILASSQLRRFGHVGPGEICSSTFDLCDDPVWVGCMAALLLAAYVWMGTKSWRAKLGSRASPDLQRDGGDTANPATDSVPWMPEQLRIRARPSQNSSIKEDHFDVVAADRVVGHIYRFDPSQSDWFWSILPSEFFSVEKRGKATSFEDARAALRDAWRSQLQ
jgi:hypothetical protein